LFLDWPHYRLAFVMNTQELKDNIHRNNIKLQESRKANSQDGRVTQEELYLCEEINRDYHLILKYEKCKHSPNLG